MRVNSNIRTEALRRVPQFMCDTRLAPSFFWYPEEFPHLEFVLSVYQAEISFGLILMRVFL